MDLMKTLAETNTVLVTVVAILSWVVKNYFVQYLVKRDELARKEWEFRLLEVWSPLHFWSGVILFDSPKRDAEDPKNALGVKEFAKILEKSAHLIPQEHYALFVRALEIKTKQKAGTLDIEKYKRARTFAYGQIETLNYLLYGRYPWFSAVRQSDPLGSVREFSRWIAEMLWHLLLWGFIAVILMVAFLALAEGDVRAMVGVGALGLVLVALYMYWRLRAHRAITVRQRRA